MHRTVMLLMLLITTGLVGKEPPNVLVIYSDDQGTIDLNCYGAIDLATPNLDKLAKSGVRFTQMYAPSAICSASRAGLMTGRLPVRAGVPNNVSSELGKPGMPTTEVTIAEMLRTGGYRTAHVGKWHLGFTPETMPLGQGFDSSFGHMGGCIDNYSHFFYWQGPNRHDLWQNGKEIWRDGQYFPTLMVEQVKSFLKEPQKKPFFIYWAINMPHYPMQGTEKWRKHYAKLPSPRRQYAEFVSTMDELVGEVLDELDRLGLKDNTLIIFQSDHGHSTEERAFFGGGNAGPHRGAKGCLFEGGLRVPSIASLPGQIPAGETRTQLAVGCDWLPTIAEYCNVAIPKVKLDGRSLKTVISDGKAPTPHANFYWQLGQGKAPQWVVRQGDWKLLGNPRDTSGKGTNIPLGGRMLVNLNDDPGEKINLLEKEPEVAARLEKIRQEWLKDLP
ncbi:MAG: sulfatase-like hydrolase/transferase [Zavarzinella sp.]